MSEFPTLLGLCASDIAQVARWANRAQQRLVYDEASGDEGWWGSWAEVRFYTVSRITPYITLPREIARLDSMAICQEIVPVQNQFYEYLRFGNGTMPKTCTWQTSVATAYTRNNVPTWTDLANAPQGIRVYSTDPADAAGALRLLIQGTDQNGMTVYSLDGPNQVQGEYVTFTTPFADSLYQWNSITGIQKDVTTGTISIYQVDPTTGAEVFLLTMAPGEQSASYRRYYLGGLPASCTSQCAGTSAFLTVSAIAKLEPIPVTVDQDYFLIQNTEALIEEAQAIRLGEMDSDTAKKESLFHHGQAIRLLNGELRHYLGYDQPSISLKVFGANKLIPSFR